MMNHTRTLQALGLLLLLGAPACEGKFGDLGNDNTTAGHSGTTTVGGAATGGTKAGLGGGAVRSEGGSAASTTASCVYVPLPMPFCDTGTTAEMQYDSAGCPTGYLCVNNGGSGGAPNSGTGSSCNIVPLPMPQCTNGSAVMQYDAAGCPTGYVCPDDPSVCVCTGPHPMIANVLCSDGTTGGPVCSRQADGACSWIIRSCPPSNGSGGASSIGGNAGVGGSKATGCLYNGSTYAVGASFKSSDGCNSCSCTAEGLVACTLMACLGSGGTNGAGGSNGTTCGAVPLVMPVCADGTAVMKYDTAGCPIGYQCPDTSCQCTAPSPAAPTRICADGTTGGPTCAIKADGSCSWTVRACPTDPAAGGSSGVACVYNQVTYAPGSSFASSDGCNTCSCSATGQVMCTLRACAAAGATGVAVSG